MKNIVLTTALAALFAFGGVALNAPFGGVALDVAHASGSSGGGTGGGTGTGGGGSTGGGGGGQAGGSVGSAGGNGPGGHCVAHCEIPFGHAGPDRPSRNVGGLFGLIGLFERAVGGILN